MLAFASLDDVSTWAQVPAAQLALFHAGFGCGGGDGLRAIGAEPAADFDAFVDGLVLADGNALSRSTRSSLKLFGRGCRLTTGSTLTRAQESAAAAALAFQNMAAAPVAAPAVLGRTGVVKLSNFTDQGNADEVPAVTGVAIVASLVVYDDRMGEVPTEDSEPSSEQFTGIAHLISLHSPPYADFSVFGPYAVRNRKRMHLNGFHMYENGTLQKCELFGPPNYEV